MAWNGLDPNQLYLAEARANAVLLGASAWDVAPIELEAAHANFISLYFTYTRGGAAGAFDYRIQVSPFSNAVVTALYTGAEEWFQLSARDIGAVAAGTDVTSLVQRNLTTYTATGAAVESFPLGPIELRGTIERIRVGCRETGNVAAPGTMQIQALLR